MENELKDYSVATLWQATGGFHRICLIGEGGFGAVYRAMVGLAPVAVKVLDHGGMQGLKEFHNEMALSRSIQHPHVVRLLGYAAEGGTQCLVYELMSQGNLEDRLACKDGVAPLRWPHRVKVAAQVAYALSYLHQRGITHRDIKPANIFLDCNLDAKLGDIGLAAMEGRQQGRPSQSSEAIGTWWYLAPEYKAQGRSSTRTDVYAFGLSLLQMVSAGQPKDIIRACQNAMEECSLQAIVDPSAGQWESRSCERLVKLGLWCCMHVPEQRPAIATVLGELVRMVNSLAASGVLRDEGNDV
ncbi:MAG: hypothetical protein WDW36_002551 [Sanguina aurantia]